MKSAIHQRAIELGFDDCKFTTAAPVESASYFNQWLEAGRHADMAYLARTSAKRVDPQRVLPGARSVICLAVSYAVPDGPKTAGAFPGVVARYARFADYHKVLSGPLDELASYIRCLTGGGTNTIWYVDTGPVIERALAQRAGLGFIGKHTNLVSQRLGNWFFLAEILTTTELEPDPPAKNRCGRCNRCIAACPTGAITAPFQLDARKCISYLTIENKGAIPVELRPLIGNRIFGCDECLAACPWNRFARPGKLMQPHARPDLTAIDLNHVLSLDQAGFDRLFGNTPIARAKLRGLLRNACVALGNLGNAAALTALERLTLSEDALLAEHAAWAIAQITRRIGPE
ncbi:MAG: tRNA epoxyqueuosine(34) reductase QueG [Verrucomicrobiae bacterium]|nr:tRNA epoxyqueuosine(34) reductase QueG [Verrucomicrobiae bacterium]